MLVVIVRHGHSHRLCLHYAEETEAELLEVGSRVRHRRFYYKMFWRIQVEHEDIKRENEKGVRLL